MNKLKELDKEITEILMCMYNSGDTTNCLADIKKLILEAEMKKGLQDFQICREEIEKARTELLEEIKTRVDTWGGFEDDGGNLCHYDSEILEWVNDLLNKKDEQT